MYEVINEKIQVAAIFGQGYNDVTPVKFRWQGREVVVAEIGYIHKVRDGQNIVHVFSCTDGANFYELRFDAQDLKWTLGRTWDGEAT